ncbi:MAG: UDP-N-acetylmuramate dehydrogenase [Trueperaceae bacterium]|nr:UDP-N-acetylmuramate dehydrogenase [Trueperaceae bacterium]
MPETLLAKRTRLAAYTTLKVGGEAELWEVNSTAELREASSEPFRVLGAGSNLLISDEGVKERVVKLGKSFNNLEDFSSSGEVWLGAATPLPGLVRRAASAGLSGWEGLLGIPAVLGGAIAMNAGTRYGCIADTLQEVELMVGGEIVRLFADELKLSYRHSELPQSAIITRAKFKLSSSSPETVEALLAKVDAARKGQPKIKSAGCAFKNPEPDSAGRLIDEAGLKGLRVGDAMVSLEHGNFIVNLGQASATDVLKLIDMIRSRVKTPLALEWQLWGFGEAGNG